MSRLCRVHRSVYLGDNLIKGGIAKQAREFQTTKADDATILLSKVKDPSRFGVAKFDHNNKLVSLEEKPKKPASNLALTGIYLFRPAIFDMTGKLKPSWRNEFEITEAIHARGADSRHCSLFGETFF